MRALFTKSIYAYNPRNGQPGSNHATCYSQPSQDVVMLLTHFGCTHPRPPPTVPPFLLTQNLINAVYVVVGGRGQNNLHLKPTGRSPLKMRVPAPATAGSNKGSQTSDCENVSFVVGSPGSQVKSTKGHSESDSGGEPSFDMTW